MEEKSLLEAKKSNLEDRAKALEKVRSLIAGSTDEMMIALDRQCSNLIDNSKRDDLDYDTYIDRCDEIVAGILLIATRDKDTDRFIDRLDKAVSQMPRDVQIGIKTKIIDAMTDDKRIRIRQRDPKIVQDAGSSGFAKLVSEATPEERAAMAAQWQDQIDALRKATDKPSGWSSWRDVKGGVGTIGVKLVGGRKVNVLPCIQVDFGPEEPVGVPNELLITWRQDPERMKEGDKSFIWITHPDPTLDTGGPFFCYKVKPEHRVIFEELREKWGWWNLVIRVVAPNGAVIRTGYFQVFNHGPVYQVQSSPTEFIDSLDQVTSDAFRKDTMKALIRRHEERGTAIAGDKRRFAMKESLRVVRILEEIGGPLPWPVDRTIDHHKKRDGVVENYLAIVQDLYNLSRGVRGDGSPAPDWSEQKSIAVRTLWALMRQARIFEFTESAYAALHHAADVYTTERIACQKWKKLDEGTVFEFDISDEEKHTHVEKIMEAGQRVPFPDKMPFEACFLAWGDHGITMNEGLFMSRFMYATDWLEGKDPVNNPHYQEASAWSQFVTGRREGMGRIVGHLVTASGEVWEFFLAGPGFPPSNPQPRPTLLCAPICHRHEGSQWTLPYSLVPWIVTAAIAGVNEHQTVIEEQNKRWEDQKRFKKAMKAGFIKRPIPPPYYTVHMRDDIIQKSARKEFRRQLEIEWSHRWDVRGHRMVRIQRGRIPIDEKTERKLEKRGYKVYYPPFRNLDAESYQILMSRGVSPPEPNEWIAVLVSWRDAFVKGPADKPYVPSVHKPTKGVIA